MSRAQPIFVVVGANLTGGAAATTLRSEGFDGRVILIGDESHPPYERPPLSKEYLRGEDTFDDALLRPGPDQVGVGFSPNGRHALVRISSRDFKDAWLVVVDLPSLARREVVHLHDDAWLGVDGFLGPGAWTGWLGDGETAYYASEETGYAHLYVVSAAGGLPGELNKHWRAISVGSFDCEYGFSCITVSEAVLDDFSPVVARLTGR